MGSEVSKVNRPKTGAIPSIPQEIVDEILGHLSTDPGSRLSLQACTLVSKSWVPSCRQHLFHTILFTPENIARWVKTFPVPEESPAHLVRDLRLLIGARNSVPETFFGYIPWFKNTEGVSILQDAGSPALWIPSFRGLPQSVTSLTIKADRIFLRQIQNMIMWLPNLDDLVFSGSFVAVERGALLGIGTNLRGRFGGRLRLTGEYSSASLVNVLLEIPTGLHFTEVQIHTTCESLLSTVRLTEACAKTLVKLSYMVDLHDGRERFVQSFDFSKMPNLQEVHFWVGWVGGGLLWIPKALSTLRPATSPRLSAIHLTFIHPYTPIRSVEATIWGTGDDLKRIADEATRIEREFEGAVEFTMSRDSVFHAVSGALKILLR